MSSITIGTTIYQMHPISTYMAAQCSILIEKVFNPDSLTESHYQIRKSIRFKYSVQHYGLHIFTNVFQTCRDFENDNYIFRPLKCFWLNERGHERYIQATDYYDRVPIHALCQNILIPTLRKYIIYNNCASIKGRGIDMSRNHIKRHLQKYYRKHGNKGWVLIFDFKKFFDSIDHEKVLEFLSDKFDSDVVEFMDKWLLQYSKDGKRISVGIGGEPSQIIGVSFPTKIDNFIKIVERVKFYERYMDDGIIIHQSKEYLKNLLTKLIFVAGTLNLTINLKKTRILPISKSFIFLKIKWKLTETGRVVAKHTSDLFTRERRKLRKFKIKMCNGDMAYEDIENQFKSIMGNVKKFNNFESKRSLQKYYNLLYLKDFKKGEFYETKCSIKRVA